MLWVVLVSSFNRQNISTCLMNAIFFLELTSMAQLDTCQTGDQEVVVSIPAGQQHIFMEIDYDFLQSFSPVY